jgi:hypothetical protein
VFEVLYSYLIGPYEDYKMGSRIPHVWIAETFDYRHKSISLFYRWIGLERTNLISVTEVLLF